MPKKQQRSGFYYFMLDYKEKKEKCGVHFPNGLRDVQSDPQCSAAWTALSEAERNKYNYRAKDKKRTGKLTTTGESVELLEKEKIRQMKYETDMKEMIDQSIKQANKFGNLTTLSFYFIHVNHFYTKINMDCNTTDYIPAEYAVVEFSLKDGVKRILHQIIKTKIEPGYTREYIEHSDTTHKLSHDLAEGEEDYAVMYRNLVEFLNINESSKNYPPLYTNKKMKTVVPCLFDRMTAACGETVNFDLYSLEYLFGTLMGIVNENFPENPCRSIFAGSELDKDLFFWTPNIECAYHVLIEGAGPYCSQSIVQQWAFTITDYCCPKLSITMLPGIHCPFDNLINSFESMKVQKISTLKSNTGMSEAYRLKVGNRTYEEEQRRRNQGGVLTIIDYSKDPSPSSHMNYSAASESSVTAPRKIPQKQMREPKTMAKVFATLNDVPVMNDQNFPAIGGRGKAILNKTDAIKPSLGRGRGGIHVA